nr:hypothetical protein [uncultured Azospirillum sp.]
MNRRATSTAFDAKAQAETLEDVGTESIAHDLLQGAEAIGAFMGLDPRQVYYQSKRLPIFKIGALICARKSTLIRWIEEQESRTRNSAA